MTAEIPTDVLSFEPLLKTAPGLETLMRALLNASPDFICFKDGQGRWIAANESGLALFQLGSDYACKTDEELAEQAPPQYREAFRICSESDERTWLARTTLQEEQVIPGLDGGQRYFDVIKVPLFLEDGSRYGMVVLGRDISDRKQAEIRLYRRGAILDALISTDWLLYSAESWQKAMPAALELIGKAARFTHIQVFMNTPGSGPQTCVELVGWQAPELAAASSGVAVREIDFDLPGHQRWGEMLARGEAVFGTQSDFPASEHAFFNQRQSQSIALLPIHTENQWWGLISLERFDSPERISPEEIGALLAASRSIGIAIQRDSANKRLGQASIAFDTAAEGIMICDAENRITGINKGFTEITGYSESEVLGLTPGILNSGIHTPGFFETMWASLEQTGRWRGEIRNRRKNGEIYPEWLTITVVKNSENQISHYVAVFADISEIKHSQQRLYELVNHDPLTGLPNRRLLNELLEHAIKRAERENTKIALLFVDLDRFKNINDTLGHQVGDRLLKKAAQRLSASVRDSDTIARLGGDEFVVMMEFMGDIEDPATVAKKIISGIQDEFVIDNYELFIGASIGISVFPEDGRNADDLIKAADIAMYQVKNEGKNDYRFYASQLSDHARERLTLDTMLRRALERRQLEVYYQPQVSLETGKIIAAEALLRWHHPELGIVSPAKFIPLAEETGLIVQIGEWVLREAANHAMCLAQLGIPLQWIAVNVSGVQIHRSNFADTVYGVLVETGCEPGMLELEITESAIMRNVEYVIDVCQQLKAMGVRLALDDFGTGYSSLSYLKKFPLDKLKIDQSFVHDLPDDAEDAAIAGAIIALGQNLGLRITAEGVEKAEQRDFLYARGCTEGQGYLYSQPISFEELVNLLKNSPLPEIAP
jgi:diguanylate cyclase (GGDEF)-like protein/PAS domain S-box-containing protein